MNLKDLNTNTLQVEVHFSDSGGSDTRTPAWRLAVILLSGAAVVTAVLLLPMFRG